jgi:hypothetical protein
MAAKWCRVGADVPIAVVTPLANLWATANSGELIINACSHRAGSCRVVESPKLDSHAFLSSDLGQGSVQKMFYDKRQIFQVGRDQIIQAVRNNVQFG